MPDPHLPKHSEHDVVAEFVVPEDGRLVLPATSHDLIVHELRLEPAPLAEQFGEGARWFTYEPGTRVVVHGRFRHYAAGDAPWDPSELFAGAVRVREGAAQ